MVHVQVDKYRCVYMLYHAQYIHIEILQIQRIRVFIRVTDATFVDFALILASTKHTHTLTLYMPHHNCITYEVWMISLHQNASIASCTTLYCATYIMFMYNKFLVQHRTVSIRF